MAPERDLPGDEFQLDARLEMNAKEFLWIENTDGNHRGIVRFDLAPECTVTLRWQR